MTDFIEYRLCIKGQIYGDRMGMADAKPEDWPQAIQVIMLQALHTSQAVLPLPPLPPSIEELIDICDGDLFSHEEKTDRHARKN